MAGPWDGHVSRPCPTRRERVVASVVRVTLHMTVRAGCSEEFRSAWRVVADETSHVPGNLRQALLQDPQDPCVFVITSDWESAEAFHRYERSHDQDVLVAPLRRLRRSVSMTVHDLVVHVDGGVARPLTGQ
jgi:quinol monooxygenase YgiN